MASVERLSRDVLTALLERSLEQLEAGELCVLKPRELLEAVRLLEGLREDRASEDEDGEVPVELWERLRRLLDTGGRWTGKDDGTSGAP